MRRLGHSGLIVLETLQEISILDEKLQILVMPIAALVGGCLIASFFMGLPAILVWVAAGWIIYGVRRYG